MIKLNNKYKQKLKLQVVFLFWGIICLFNGHASNTLEVSLLTCSLGEQVYATFGHSALRIRDKESGTDKVYNFGMFDFDTPNFQMKFMQGKLQYELGIMSFDEFMKTYRDENRLVVEQILNLTDDQKEVIIKQLDFLYRPENRSYLYEFCRKNCTTALRDLIFNAISIDTSYQTKSINKTYRTLFNECLGGKSWLHFGMNLILGSGVDKDINVYESMFLPDYLKDEIEKVKINGQNLVTQETKLNTIQEAGFNYQNIFSPLAVFSALLLFIFFWKSVNLKPFIFAITGIVGILIIVLWLTTEHVELKNNFNILWCNPLYLLSAILILFKQNNFQRYLSYFYLLLILAMSVIWIIGYQAVELSFVPLVLILAIYNVRNIKAKANIDCACKILK